MSSASAVSEPARGESTLSLIAIALSLFTVAIGILIEPTTGWAGFLVAGFYGLSLAVGASLFAAINAVTGAKWFAPLNPVAAVISRTLIVPSAALALTFLLGLHVLYPWASNSGEVSSHLMHEKEAWLNAPFFLARAGIVILAFLGLTGSLFRTSPDGATKAPTRGMGAFFIVLFAGCISVATWDWMMSLEPEWFSTMYGVYGFAGTFLGGIAAVTVVSLLLSQPSNERLRIGNRQVYDLGSLLFGFAMFWAYIWFCQYMLIWYANIPEETPYFALRLSGGWTVLFWLNLVLNFIVPFFVLLSSHAKRHRSTLLQVAGIVLIGRWLDIYLMVGPSTGDASVIPAYAIAATVAVMLGMILIGKRALQRSAEIR